MNLLYLLFFFVALSPEATRYNNADPYPVYSTTGSCDFFTNDIRRSLKKDLNMDGGDEANNFDVSFSLMPFFQSAKNGSDWTGRDRLTYFDNSNSTVSSSVQAANAATGQTTTAVSSLTYHIPMPLSAIPEPWNMFGLFYPYSNDDIDRQISPNDFLNPKIDNRISKVLARKLGYNHVLSIVDPELPNDNNGAEDPLNYGYFNYRNHYFNVLSSPGSRDPDKLFGYGYWNFDYKKYGLRGTLEGKIFDYLVLKLYFGFAHVEQNHIRNFDTTSLSQGPAAARMLSFYPSDSTSGGSVPYIQPNIYPLTTYAAPRIDDGIDTPNYLTGDNVDDTGEAENPEFSDQFKSLYIQNVQNNLKGIQDVLDLDFNNYRTTQIEDPTIEFLFRKIFLFNTDKKDNNKWPIYALIPHFSTYITVPTAPRVEKNILFGKPIANNGHFAYGGNFGFLLDFLNTISFGTSIGATFFNSGRYNAIPVPTSVYQEGIFPYIASGNIKPGYNLTAALSMQADRFFDNFFFWSEYRYVKHGEDAFCFDDPINPYKTEQVDNLFARYDIKSTQLYNLAPGTEITTTNITDLKTEDTLSEGEQPLTPALTTTAPNNIVPDIDPNDIINPVPAVLYWGNIVQQNPNVDTGSDYESRAFSDDPSDSDKIDNNMPPFPTKKDIIPEYLEGRSSFDVHLLNFSIKYSPSEYLSFGIFVQQPISLRNAYNSGTYGICFEMFM